eukprot:CAMPEP_0173201396 /NCGR_PEP_ID=MMETSP1141-20130122/18329_1 /TAXON_ID=483371 /ORGANISM="non described non described, Strain CCMP2298" /LENGTH=131 /DNA_ID=CAMNT_0014126515 /DNA_START=124 /DNA_END=519 /DNA_ORIENTATION=+
MNPIAAGMEVDVVVDPLRASKVYMMSPITRRVTLEHNQRPVERRQFDHQGCLWKHMTTIIMAIFLMGGGLALIITGTIFKTSKNETHGTDMIILGLIMCVPGFYGTYRVVRISRRVWGGDNQYEYDPEDET